MNSRAPLVAGGGWVGRQFGQLDVSATDLHLIGCRGGGGRSERDGAQVAGGDGRGPSEGGAELGAAGDEGKFTEHCSVSPGATIGSVPDNYLQVGGHGTLSEGHAGRARRRSLATAHRGRACGGALSERGGVRGGGGGVGADCGGVGGARGVRCRVADRNAVEAGDGGVADRDAASLAESRGTESGGRRSGRVRRVADRNRVG